MQRLSVSLTQAMFAAGATILAIGPVIWLVGTWRDPSFASNGGYLFAIVAALLVWSLTSPRLERRQNADRFAIGLLAATALLRLSGQVLAIDTIGALALALDVYAIARLLGVDRRQRPLSPVWLAVAFAFCLPLERIVQRCLGFALQELSARGACGVLSANFQHVTCEGVRIGVNGADVMVDLPCSGSQALVVFGFVFALLAALARPSRTMSVIGVAIALVAAVGGNIIRISLLASGVAVGASWLGFDVMRQPWHDLVGLLSLGASSLLLIVWARRAKASAPATRRTTPLDTFSARILGPRVGAVFCALALAAVTSPHRPIDVAMHAVSISAPSHIDAYAAVPIKLSAQERAYFQQYGGSAVKAQYGPFALLLTRTTSPLRHLHAPDECLRGLGYRVEYLGLRFAPSPSAVYRATAPDGRTYDIETRFISNRGHVAASVSEAVWIWLQDRSTVWTAVQRVAPAEASRSAIARFDAGVTAALDLPADTMVFAQRE